MLGFQVYEAASKEEAHQKRRASESRAAGLGFRGWGSGIGGWVSGFGAWFWGGGLGTGVRVLLGVRVQGLTIRV